jgi:hypothetical protein
MIANLLNCALEVRIISLTLYSSHRFYFLLQASSSIDEHGIAFMMLTLATTFHRVCINDNR